MKYQALTTSRALEDIRELLEYIHISFAEPQIAARMKEAILDAIYSLSEFPLRNPISQDETLHPQDDGEELLYHLSCGGGRALLSFASSIIAANGKIFSKAPSRSFFILASLS